MPSQAVYKQYKRDGKCGHCGRPNDQHPYAACSQCYTPRPRRGSTLFPGLRSDTLAYQDAYQDLQNGKAPRAAIEIGCCGTFHDIHQPCPHCGRVFFGIREGASHAT